MADAKAERVQLNKNYKNVEGDEEEGGPKGGGRIGSIRCQSRDRHQTRRKSTMQLQLGSLLIQFSSLPANSAFRLWFHGSGTKQTTSEHPPLKMLRILLLLSR